jgi:hypothetical protein
LPQSEEKRERERKNPRQHHRDDGVTEKVRAIEHLVEAHRPPGSEREDERCTA